MHRITTHLRFVLVAALLVAGCRSKTGEERSADHAPAIQSGKGLLAEPLPRGKGDTPTRIVIRSQEEVSLDVGAGRGSDIIVAPLQASLGRLSLLVEDPWGACWCSPDHTCPEFEPPPRVLVRVSKDSPLEIEWIGKLVRYGREADGDRCGTSFVPVPGEYMFRVCDTSGKRCAVKKVHLPPEKDVVLELEPHEARAEACPSDPMTVERLATYHLVYMELYGILLDRIASCDPSKAVCVPPADLEATKKKLRGEKCSLLVTPAGDEVESLVFLPLPEGTHGGESFQQFLSPDGMEVLRVRFEQ